MREAKLKPLCASDCHLQNKDNTASVPCKADRKISSIIIWDYVLYDGNRTHTNRADGFIPFPTKPWYIWKTSCRWRLLRVGCEVRCTRLAMKWPFTDGGKKAATPALSLSTSGPYRLLGAQHSTSFNVQGVRLAVHGPHECLVAKSSAALVPDHLRLILYWRVLQSHSHHQSFDPCLPHQKLLTSSADPIHLLWMVQRRVKSLQPAQTQLA